VQVEPGEIPQYALQRELHEELGVQVGPSGTFCTASCADRSAGLLDCPHSSCAAHAAASNAAPNRPIACDHSLRAFALSARVQVPERALQALTFVSHRYGYWSHNFLALLFGEAAASASDASPSTSAGTLRASGSTCGLPSGA
jgi:ADP-ribose pyrophosphatase YjhB (NUDIX family)